MFHHHGFLTPAGWAMIIVFLAAWLPLTLYIAGWCIYKAIRRSK